MPIKHARYKRYLFDNFDPIHLHPSFRKNIDPTLSRQDTTCGAFVFFIHFDANLPTWQASLYLKVSYTYTEVACALSKVYAYGSLERV